METLKRRALAVQDFFIVTGLFIAGLVGIVALLGVMLLWLHLADVWFVRPYTFWEILAAFGPLFLYLWGLGVAGAHFGRRFRRNP